MKINHREHRGHREVGIFRVGGAVGGLFGAVNYQWVWMVAVGFLMAAHGAAAFYDDTVGDKQVAYAFLDQVEKEVGYEAFSAASEGLTLPLALTLGKLDKAHLTS